MKLDTLLDFLNFVLTVGGAGVVLAFLLEKFPGLSDLMDGLDPKRKRVIVFLLSLCIPTVATVVGVALGYYVPSEDLIYQALKIGLEVFGAATATHLLFMK